MKQVCKLLALQSTLNMLGDRKGGRKASLGIRTLTEKFDVLLSRKEDSQHAAQLIFTESRMSLLVRTICQFGSNARLFFFFLSFQR